MRGRILFAVFLMVLLAGVAVSQSFYASKSSVYALATIPIDVMATGATYDNCIQWHHGGNYEASAEATCGTGVTVIPFANDVYISEMCWITQSTFTTTNDGCDFRLTTDGGSSQLGTEEMSVPPTQSQAEARGDIYCVSIGSLVEAGTILELQGKDGTNCEAGSSCACGTGLLDQAIVLKGHDLL